MEKYIYLSWSYGSDVNMLENAGWDAPRLLGQLYITHLARRTVFIEVAPGSPDIGDELQEVTTMHPYIYLSRSRQGVVNMITNICSTPAKLLGQLYVPEADYDHAVWHVRVAKGSPDIGDSPSDQQPPGVRAVTVAHEGQPADTIVFDSSTEASKDVDMFKNKAFRIFPVARDGVIRIREHNNWESLGRLLCKLYVPYEGTVGGFGKVFQIAPDSPDIGDEPVNTQPPGVSDSAARKGMPLARGVLDYFPNALLEVARTSRLGNEQHNPGQPMHWAYGKSADHADALLRHLIDRRSVDSDGVPHVAKVAWRALALLQAYLEDQDPELHGRMDAQRELMKAGK